MDELEYCMNCLVNAIWASNEAPIGDTLQRIRDELHKLNETLEKALINKSK